MMAPHKPEVEPYDLKSDPMEFTNLSDDPQHVILKQSLYKTLVAEVNEIEKNMVLVKKGTTQKAKERAALNYQSQMSGLGPNTSSSDEEVVNYWESVTNR